MAETLWLHSCLLILDLLNLAVVESSHLGVPYWTLALGLGHHQVALLKEGTSLLCLSWRSLTGSHVICAISASDSAFHVFHLFLSLYSVWLCSLLTERRVCFGGMGEGTWHNNQIHTCLTGTSPSLPQGTQWQLVGMWDILPFSLHFLEFQQSEIKSYEILK